MWCRGRGGVRWNEKLRYSKESFMHDKDNTLDRAG